MTAERIDIRALVAALGERLEQLAAHLVGGGPDQSRRIWKAARKSQGGIGDSLEIELRGDKRGIWIHRASGQGGDALDLVRYALGSTAGDAIAWARDWLGGDFTAPPPPRQVEPPTTIASSLAPRWRAFWSRCHFILDGSPPHRYLAGRCCARPPNDVRWNPETWHPHEKRALPAIVSLITDIVTGEPMSLHFTFITPDGIGKAEIERPRLYLAGHRKIGGVVRLDADEDVGAGIIIGEGLETCLSYRLQHAPVWATLDAGNLAQFPVLPGIEGITVLVDRDPAGEDAFAKVRARYRDAGFSHALDIIRVEAPGDLNDLNDLARAP